jgi:predicted transcriptional regulator
MEKIYQPIVVKRTDEIIEILVDSNFFIDYELSNTETARKFILDELTSKFIKGDLDMEHDELFTEEEFTTVLNKIIAGTILGDLKEKGLLNSYEDDDTEETFFLTDEGKEMLLNMKKQ